ncbi:unnamed protein product [Spirodela intermedia]|uniref:Uncharacterized protein n=1 Tax=Spirodela intermedia TaxID=51605 RepID=A0A7I8IX27_SPIIN|nr:unnamed protein product [Spirodela intermedia]CAA6661721.1 unnamed protein product [Spirodela intermedia]
MLFFFLSQNHILLLLLFLHQIEWLLCLEAAGHPPPRLAGTAAYFRQMDFSRAHWCCSARAKVAATVSGVISRHSFSSQRSFSRSSPYRSAAASRC